MTDNPHHVDVHVGTRIRQRRLVVGMSQQALAEHLGLTFQQIQKYEKGRTRVAASRLWEIAHFLGVPPGWFFGEMPGEPDAPDVPMRPFERRDVQVAMAASKWPEHMKRSLLDFLRSGANGAG